MSLKAKFAAMSLKAKIAVICGIAAVIGTAAVIVGIILTKEDSYRVLKVFEMAGSSIVNRESSGDLDAYVGMNLENGDTLTVGEESTLRLSLDNDKYILLDEGTVMKLNAAGNSADSRTTLELRQGTILNEITNPLSADSLYEVATPKATMAVRGTSFSISVEKDENGGYIIIVNTFQGKVEVWLLDKDGNPTGQKALVTADKCISIYTEPDADTGNPAEIDGISRFVYIDEDGNISDVPEGADPVYDIIYKFISKNVKVNALRSNESNLMILADEIVKKLKDSVSDDSDKDNTETSVSSTASDTTETEITTISETDAPAVTTVPITEESETASETVSASVNDTEPSDAAQTSMAEAPSDSITLRETSASTAAAVTTPTVTEASSDTASITTAVSDKTGKDDQVPGTKPFVTLPSDNSTFMTLPPVITYTERETSATSAPVFTFPNNSFMQQTTPATFATSEFKPIIIVSSTETAVTTPAETTVPIPEETTVTIPAETTITTASEETAITTVPETSVTEETTTVSEVTTTEETTTVPEETTTEETTTTAVKYTVSFVCDGEQIDSVDVDEGGTVSHIPAANSKTGYSFVGWFDEADSEFDTTVTVTSNMTVYAVYEPVDCTVIFEAEGAENVPAPITVKYGQKPTANQLPNVPTKDNYTTDGKWYYTVNSEESVFDTTVTVTSNMTVYAVYKKIHTVTYYAKYTYDSTTYTDLKLIEQKVVDGNTPEKPSLPTTITHTVDTNTYKYVLDNDKWQTQFSAIGTINADTPIYVEYTNASDIYTMTNAFIDDHIVKQGTYSDGETINLPETANTVTIDGKEVTFAGWGYVTSGGGVSLNYGTDAAGITPSNDSPNASKPLEYRAFYQKTYTVTILGEDADGDGVSDKATKTISKICQSSDPTELLTMSYYLNFSAIPGELSDFAWYYKNEDGVEKPFGEGSFTYDVTLYYKTYYTVKFIAENDEELYEPTKVYYVDNGHLIDSLPTIEDGYKWVNAETGEVFTEDTPIYSDITLKKVPIS
ncbi:MAG: InlB B-repeat-containing protein [Oscillospiraceae bacterium]|nr:InlB B-repeat-containing protein [Oscillospiraceae bacterium]